MNQMKKVCFVLFNCMVVVLVVGCSASGYYEPSYMPGRAQEQTSSGVADASAVQQSGPDAGALADAGVPSQEPGVANPWEETAKDNLSTFAIDVDTGSYTLARKAIMNGDKPDPYAVRPEEFLNFFDYKYEGPAANDDKPFRIHVGGSISPFNDKHHFLRVALQGKRLAEKDRKAAHLTLLVDTSCSMSSGDKLSLAKQSLAVLVENLREGDTVAIATYAGSVRKVLAPTDASNKDVILGAIERLHSGGGTAMSDGMILAYEMASQAFQKDDVNRVIVLSDGDANIGRTSHEEILKTIEKYVAQGITMTTVGFGQGNYRDNRMEQLSNKGNGNYYYIDTIKQAKRIFGKEILGTLQVIAKDVKIQVEFNKDLVKRYRLIGYENRAIADKDFRNDKVDAGELGSGHVVTALYELQLDEKVTLAENGLSQLKPLVTVRLRHKEPQGDTAKETAAQVLATFLHRPFDKVEWTTQWAIAVASFAEVLRKSQHATDWTLQQVQKLAQTAAQKGDDDHTEMIDLIKRAQSLR